MKMSTREQEGGKGGKKREGCVCVCVSKCGKKIERETDNSRSFPKVVTSMIRYCHLMSLVSIRDVKLQETLLLFCGWI